MALSVVRMFHVRFEGTGTLVLLTNLHLKIGISRHRQVAVAPLTANK
jgi:hypothetical protein